MTKPKRYKRYSSEFKREALLRASEGGMTDKAVCEELGISTRQFQRWRDELALLGKDAFPGSGFTRDKEARRLDGPLIHHSDRGGQYSSDDFRKALKDYDIKCSMSSTGNCYDNAVVESFFAALKPWANSRISTAAERISGG